MKSTVVKSVPKRKVAVTSAISLGLVVLITLLAVLLSGYLKDENLQNELKDYQSEMLDVLLQKEGEYDEQSIVLYDTTEREAKELAKILGAKLRITKNGEFATLTLPEGITIRDIFASEEYLEHLKKMSADWTAEISDSEEYERVPENPDYNISDELYTYQDYLDYLNLSNVWSYYNGSGITVAVIDTGIDTDHPEFSGRISEYSYNATEDKIVKDYVLEDGSYDWSLIEDEQGHGTAVAGTIGAAMDGNGIVGIAPNVTIIVIKAECDENGNFLRSSDLVFGLYYAIERDVDVVNMSFGGEVNIYSDAARLGRDSDILMVAAAGNDGSATPMYPAADENVIGVGALADDSWELANYSNYGEGVDIVAPGTVYTTFIGGEYGTIHGTSFSSPIVAATLALMKSDYTYRYATNASIVEILYASAYDLGDLGRDYYYGYGAIDVHSLLMGKRGTVTFDYLTDEIDETTQIFIYDNPLQNIPEPERLYCVFDGWYYDIECTESLDLYRDAFNGDLTLYAKWVNEDDGVPYTYVVLDDGTVEIRSYTGHRKYITIPAVIDGRMVSSIGDFAFAGTSNLREVELPDTLVHIGLSAFEGCSNLVSMVIPDNVVEIEESAFKDNIRLSYITIGKSSHLKKIGNFAFSGCVKLKTVDLPKALESINGSAFYGATSINKINVDNANQRFASTDGILFNKSKTELVAYPAAITAEYTLPDITHTVGTYAFAYSSVSCISLNNAEVIGDDAFAHSKINKIVIPDSITRLGSEAFLYCTNLSSVAIGTGISEISNYAFYGAFALRSVSIPKNVVNIGMDAFSSSGLREVEFSAEGNLVTIGTGAFENTPIEELYLPKSLSAIGASAFEKCYNLNKVVFADGSSFQSIGENAFAYSMSLETIVFPETLRIIGDKAFVYSGLSGTITIPASLEYFGAGAFASCHSITDFDVNENNAIYTDFDGVVYTKDAKTVVAYPAGNGATEYSLHDGTQTVGSSAFEGSNNLLKINVTEGVSVIMDCGFYRCENVTVYSLPSTLVEIREYAFSENYSLPSIRIPDKVVTVGRYAFAFDDNLRTIDISDTTEMARIGFATFAYTGITSFRVPANISTIAQYAFEGCDNLRTVTFAKNSKLESISAYMFLGAENISTIRFESGSALTSIQAHGFEGMTNLRTLDFGDAKLTNIDNYAFRYCSSLSSLELPETLENIGRYAFYKCTSLRELSVPSATEHIGAYAFYGTEKCNLYFASEYLPMYLDEHWDNGLYGYYTGVINVITDGDWKYATKTNGNIAIIEYLGSDTVIDLTALDLGGSIDTIGGYAFAGSEITDITLPDSLIEIQRYAFAHTKHLAKITLPENLKYIASYAFLNSAIETVEFAGSNVEVIERYAFAFTDDLTSVEIPSSLKTLGSYAFYSSGISNLTFAEGFSISEIPESAFASTNITSVVIPDSVTRIHSSAFRDNMNLKSVTLGSGTDLRIDANAFYNTGIETLYIPENLRYIGEYSFIGLEGLEAYIVDTNNPYYTSVNGVLYNKDKTKLIAFPAGREGSFEVPAFVENIGFGAFENSHLSSVTFADGINLLTIGWRAFFNAGSITEITIPDSVVSIDYYAFAGCKNLTTVNFAENNKLKGIYEGAFFGCQRLENITIPDSIVEISDYAFYGCMSLEDLPLSDTSGVKGIFDYAFAYTGIKNLTIPDGVIDIGQYAFKGALLEKAYIPNTNAQTLIIGIGAFEDCTHLEEITVPFIGASYEDTDITWFGYIFGAGGYEANSTYVPELLTKVVINDDISFIGSYAFYQLAGLQEIDVPVTVNTVYYWAFNGTIAKYELKNEISLAYVGYGGEVRSVTEASSDHFGKGITGDLRLADGVTSIGSDAFRDCRSLTSIEIPDSVTEIGWGAFSGCSSLTSIEIPDSVTSIGAYAFWNCSSLTSIKIPDGVTSIGDGAFYDCRSLTSIEIPDSVTGIGSDAFSGCSSLTSIEIPDGVTSIGAHAFSGCLRLYVIYNSSDIELTIESQDNGYLAYYAKLIVDKDGNKIYKTEGSDFTYIDTADGFRFTYENGEYELIAYLGNEETVTLPTDINGNFYEIDSIRGVKNVIITNGVTSIGDSAFYDCTSLTSIEIPDSVTSISAGAFLNCTSLTSITIGNSVTSIGACAFWNCTSLTSIEIPDGVTSIGACAFWNCTSLTSIEIPDGVTSIGDSAFEYCSNLTRIEIPDSVTSIGSSAFNYCRSLTSIEIPDSVTSIGSSVFYGCSSLASIEIPDSVTEIGSSAFSGCSSLTSIEIPDSVTYIGTGVFSGCNVDITISEKNQSFAEIDGIIYDKAVTRIIYVTESVTDVVIPATVTNISSAFYENQNIQTVKFESGSAIYDIGSYAFSSCSSLTSIEIPNSVTSIGYHAFSGCSSLTSIEIPDSVTSIGGSAFSGCSSLTSIEIPDSVTFIGDHAFYGCSSLTSIEIPDSVTRIYFLAFSYCTSLTSIEIPDGVTSIGEGAFFGCSSLTSIEIPDGVTEIGWDAFYGCSSLTSIEIPYSVTSIGSSAFYGCSSLASIEIPDSVTSIDDWTFSGCSSLTSIEIPNSVTGISSYAFHDCSSLTSIEIPGSVTSIGACAFSGCSSLYAIYNNSDIELTIGSQDNGYLAYYAKLIVDKDGNKIYKTEGSDFTYIDTADSFLFTYENGEYKLIAYLGNEETVTLPKDINGNSYEICRMGGVRKVIIPDSVTSIGTEAFFNCTSLTSITIPDSVTSIGSDAFFNCTSLTSITIPYSVTSISAGAFCGCSSLTSIEIPDGVTSIGDFAFSGCSSLTSIEIPNSVTIISNWGAFSGCSSLTSIEIPDGVTSIGSSAFSGCSSLTSIEIPNSVTSIGSYAFYGCSSLTNIEIPDSVTSIGERAFYDTAYYNNSNNWTNGGIYIGNCLIDVDNGVTSFVVRPNTSVIEVDAFAECYSLRQLTIGGDHLSLLGSLTNLETLTITSLPTEHLICDYFGYDNVPITLSKVIIKSGCDVKSSNLFYGITGVTIFVEDEKENCPWAEDYPGWNNGNKVVYGGDWHYVNYYDADGELITTHYYAASEVIKPPYVYSYKAGDVFFKFEGWDMDGDGIPDGIPATINENYDLHAIITENDASYIINYMDKDGKTVLYTYELPYGAKIPIPEDPAKKGYSFLGWIDVPEKATEDVRIYSEWLHDGDGHIYTSTTVAPTCTSDGYTLHTCSICDENYKSDIIKATGHIYGDWVVTLEPTCEEDGTMNRKCACGDVQTVIVDSDGHDYTVVSRKESTCQHEGSVEYICSECGDDITEELPLASHKYEKKYASKSWLQWLIETLLNIFFGYEGDQGYYYKCSVCNHIATTDENVSTGSTGVMSTCVHKLGDWVEVKSPSCADGYNVRYCTICNKAVEAIVVSATREHIYMATVTAPVCETKGYTMHICTNCGDSYIDSYVFALGHDYSDEWTIDVEVTCTTNGSKSRHCTRCGDKADIIIITAPGHSLCEWLETTAPTCTTDGVEQRYCEACDHSEVRVINALGHDYSDEWTIDTEATCTSSGRKSHHCLRCDNKINVTVISRLEHEYGEWTIRREPTCESSGNKVAVCQGCGRSQIETIDALGHDCLDEWMIEEPTCTRSGSKYQTCSRCDDRLNEIEIPALGHDCLDEWMIEEPTCTRPGSKYQTCSRCDDKLNEIEIPALGHDFDEWTIIFAPTCSSEGLECRYCLVCGRSESQSIEILEHSFTNYISNNDATYTEDGTKTAKCDNCDEMSTIVDIGSAFGMTKKFEDAVSDLTKNASTSVSYSELRNALVIYSTLTAEEKAEVSESYAMLMNAITAYNDKAEVANNELAEASELSFSAIVLFNFTFLSALWCLLKKKFII